MREDEKVLMKGVAEDIYQALLTREINDTASFIKWCNYIEDMKQKRVGRPRFERLPNVVPTQESLDSDPQSLEEIVQDEVERVLAPVSAKSTETRPRPTYAAVTRKYRAPVQKFPPEPRKTDVWRTADNRPVCFHCGRPGHVMRYCRERKAVFDNSRNRRRNFDDVGTEEIRRPNSFSPFYAKSHERPIPNTSLQIPVAISPIQSPGRFQGDKKPIRALVDSGASFSVISDKYRRFLKKVLFADAKSVMLKVADGNFVRPIGKCVLRVRINNRELPFEFIVLSHCSHDVILGWDFLEASQAVIDCGQNELVLEDICRDSTAPDAWNMPPGTIHKPHSLTRITVSGYQTRGDINVVLDGSKHLLFEKKLLHRPWYPHIVTEKVMSGLPTCSSETKSSLEECA
ncbi:CCHC-type domain-containing protein [Trichonephila clavipes]|nr:CCHC-type domain-containing protein [Trichonephila clavipes]